MASKGKGRRSPLLTLQTMAPPELFISIDGTEYGLLRRDDLNLQAQARLTRLLQELEQLTSVGDEASRDEIAADIEAQMASGAVSEEELAEKIGHLYRGFVRLVVPKLPAKVLDGLRERDMQQIIQVFMQATTEAETE